jgi:26S proteasome regulatory subunit N12
MKQVAIDMYNKLTAEWNRKPQNLDKCTEILNELKIILIDMGYVPTKGNTVDKQELHLARK